MKIYNAKDIIEANRLIEVLKENGIAAFSQNADAGVSAHDVSGFGLYGVDVFVDDSNAERARIILDSIA